jgi:hypothetical protein
MQGLAVQARANSGAPAATRRHANSSMISAKEGLRRAASINQSEMLSSVS